MISGFGGGWDWMDDEIPMARPSQYLAACLGLVSVSMVGLGVLGGRWHPNTLPSPRYTHDFSVFFWVFFLGFFGFWGEACWFGIISPLCFLFF